MASEATISGLSELQALLDQLPANVEKKLMRGALRAGQVVVANYAKSRAPVATPSDVAARQYGASAGSLRDSIRVSTGVRNGKVTATVKAGSKSAYYARWVEFGTAAHLIQAKNGKSLTFGGHEYKSLHHPGAKMHPFMRPALDWASNGSGPALAAVAAYMNGKITKELASQPDQTK